MTESWLLELLGGVWIVRGAKKQAEKPANGRDVIDGWIYELSAKPGHFREWKRILYLY